MKFPRSSGVLLHPTSLPGPYGIGDLSESAYGFVDFLADSGQRWWQVMPLGPTGYGDSPYQCFSAFAGNPLLLNLGWLLADGLLPKGCLDEVPDFPTERVDYGEVIPWKNALLEHVYLYFMQYASDEEKWYFHEFVNTNHHWIHDFALFMALKQKFQTAWWEWPLDIRKRESNALTYWYHELAEEINNHRLLQYLFRKQWTTLKRYANQRKVQLIGDIPIFVAYDSADVWAHPYLFFLDKQDNPTVVAGVPPDYFSETGQLWGNPLYRWEHMRRNGYWWWIERLRTTYQMVDVARLDHFRGFESYWEVPADEETAINGRWVAGPKEDIFNTIHDRLGELPIIAEDLGTITPEVETLRKQFNFPGMRVLQFAFDGDPYNVHLPHNYETHTIAYTGTHDNNTTLGWWQELEPEEQAEILHYFGHKEMSEEDAVPPLVLLRSQAASLHPKGMISAVVPYLIQEVMRSVAAVAIFPLQDLLQLDGDARMNTPGASSGNWSWRVEKEALSGELSEWLYELTSRYARVEKKAKAKEVEEVEEVEP